jgi:cell division protease FtsH
MEKRQQQFSMLYFAIAFFLLLLLQNFLTAPHVQLLDYSEFKALLRAGNIARVTLGTPYIRGQLRTEGLEQVLPRDKVAMIVKEAEKLDTPGLHPFAAVRIDDPDLVRDLEAAKVPYTGKIERTWFSTLLAWVLPIALFFGLWSLLVRRMGPQQGLMSIGKSKAKVYMEKSTGVTFKDVAGIDEAKAELQEVVHFLQHPEVYQRLGGHLPKGVLLVGPPGTGKTLLARAVAGEAGVPFFSTNGSSFVEMFVGVGAARVRDLFAQAAKHAPSLIFIDELDALGKARGASPMGANDEREQTLNQLLTEMDGFDPNTGVLLMAATNRPEQLDTALLRPGRFDRHVLVDRPDINGREAILRVHAKNVQLAPDVDLRAIAGQTPGFSGADLANVINEAALLAARAGKAVVEMVDLREAIDRMVAGLEKKNRVINPQEKEVVAFHEAGHALVAASLPGTDPVSKISIVPRGIAALGYTQQQPTEDRYLLRKSELCNRLCVLLGGRVAEELVFDDVSTGAHDDLRKVSDMARAMVTTYGMSDEMGLLTYEQPPSPFLPGITPAPSKTYSENTARQIDAEIRAIVDQAHERVRQLLNEKKSTLERLARRLLEQEVLEGAQLQELLAQQPGTSVAVFSNRKQQREA